MRSEYHQLVSHEWVKMIISGRQVLLPEALMASAGPAVKFSTECQTAAKLKFGIWYSRNITESAIHPITFDHFQAGT
jgi:hypothetical protein